jgi:hypothetical protein
MRGRILRLKMGYNPNSSSLGSIVFSFPALLLGIPVLLSAAVAVIAGRMRKKNGPDADSSEGRPSEDAE